jgi:hypothetical protein
MEGFLMGVVLAGGIAAVILMQVSGGDDGEGRPRPGSSDAAKVPDRQPIVRAQSDPASEKGSDPVGESAEPTDLAPEPATDEPSTRRREPLPGEYAELVLELVRPKEDENRRVVVSVMDDEGEPIPDAMVVFRQGSQLIYRDRADDDGIVEFDPYLDEDGPFRIDVLAPQYAVDHVPDVRPGGEVRVVLKLQPWVEGRVDAPTKGHGVVTLFTETGEQKVAIANDGSFLFENLEEGWVTVQAEVDPYGSDSETFLLESGSSRVVRLRVKADSRVRLMGEVVGWDRAGKAWMNGARLEVSAKGHYTFKKGLFGLNTIVVDVPRKALMRERFTVKGRKTARQNFRLVGESRIVGKVHAADDQVRIEGAEVRVGIDYNDVRNKDVGLFPIERVPIVFTDAQGRFEIKRLMAGVQYLVSVVKHPYGQYLESIPAQGQGVQRIELPAGPFLFGRIRGLGGVPRNAIVTARRLVEGEEDRHFNVKKWDASKSGRDKKGFYGLAGLLPALYVIRAEAAGYGATETVVDLRGFGRGRMDLRVRKGSFQEQDDAELLKRLPPVVEDGADVDEARLGDRTFLTVDAKRPESKIQLLGVRVRFYEGDMEFTAPLSFTGSKFDITGLPEATYRAVLDHPLFDRPIIQTGIKLHRGEPLTVVFRETAPR